MRSTFPKDFLFGGAISACQAEGAWNVDGRSLTIPDVVKKIDPAKRKTFLQATITKNDVEEAKPPIGKTILNVGVLIFIIPIKKIFN